MTTRDYDIEKIEEDIKRGYISSKNGRKLIDKLHSQTKDHSLEDYRKKLIEEQIKRDRKYVDIRNNPENLSEEELKRYIKLFNSNPHLF